MQGILLAAAVTTAVRQKTVSCAMNTIRYYSSVTCSSTSTTKLNMKSIPEAAVESVLVAPLDAKQKEYEGLNVCQAMKHLANADAVCFDVDSTVIQEEGIVRIIYIYVCVCVCVTKNSLVFWMVSTFFSFIFLILGCFSCFLG